ncbi:Hypothetical predicted protein [Marmota monax]|uniref:Transmembrane 4 L6 family member 5 n=1 Tax=Marmota monax TaxID=9995 RepID=A0A5E4D071_MARMO|nr:hypothetical protein GHT09_008648 [Marmota monax]VTJ87446.1 Hypothetical predicted protein [Marmota monax]
MLRSIFSSAIGMLGAIYCLGVSGAGLQTGPKCLVDDKWDYHFQETGGAYLFNRTQWYLCEEPPNVVLWNLSLFSLLVVVSCLEIVLCGIQLVNATVGVICGDCRKKVRQREVELWRDRLALGYVLTHFLFSAELSSLRLH